jgi:tetratricopeptide (TPR) repeat protein
LKRASELEPDEDDYPFNLGLLELQRKNNNGAAMYLKEAADRAPDNAEDMAMYLFALEKAGRSSEAENVRTSLNGILAAEDLPAIRITSKKDTLTNLQRIKTELELTALHTMSAANISVASASETSSAADTVGAQLRRGRQALSAGKLTEAEKEFHDVLAQDSKSAAGHRGLGETLHREGKDEAAVSELLVSIEERDSAIVRTILAKIYLEQKKPDLARAEVERALKLAPNYEDAKKLADHMKSPKQDEKKPGGDQ